MIKCKIQRVDGSIFSSYIPFLPNKKQRIDYGDDSTECEFGYVLETSFVFNDRNEFDYLLIILRK